MNFPSRIPKKPKRSARWRSQAHCNFVRSHACTNCGSVAAIEVAHVRLGSGAGVGQKPDDFRSVSLCGGLEGCHRKQHTIGEPAFWAGRDVEAIIAEFCRLSPKRYEIEQVKRERGL